jgi:hypothetical protein
MRTSKRKGIYVGLTAGPAYRREVFRSAQTPTAADGRYTGVIGPFCTVRAAQFMAEQWNNPHCQCVADAERISKHLSR